MFFELSLIFNFIATICCTFTCGATLERLVWPKAFFGEISGLTCRVWELGPDWPCHLSEAILAVINFRGHEDILAHRPPSSTHSLNAYRTDFTLD